MSIRMRQTRAKTGSRRSHHALKKVRTNTCPHCSEPKQSHMVCDNCGRYKDREVLDVHQKLARAEKRRQAKMEAMGKEDEAGSK